LADQAQYCFNLISATLASRAAFSALASNEAHDAKKVRNDCELALMWKDPPGPKAFNLSMKDRHNDYGSLLCVRSVLEDKDAVI
jgi:hypothetical protein